MRNIRLLAAAAGAPLVVVAIGSALLLAGRATGHEPWYEPEANLSEAAATRNFGEVVRLLEAGADPNVPARVRGVLVERDRDRTLTPLEAAVVMGLPEIVALLLEHGADPTPRQVRILKCLADEPPPEMKALLDRLSPDPPGDCRSVPADD